jgi:hypothetical protein
MKSLFLIAALSLATADASAAPANPGFDDAVAQCTAQARLLQASFASFIVNDGTDSRVEFRGLPQVNFEFRGCMNNAGHPLADY